MKTKIISFALSVLLAPTVSQAQQTPSTSQPNSSQVQPATASAAPCLKPAPNPQRNPDWLEKKAKAIACKQNKNLCDLPSSASEIIGQTPEAKAVPCPAQTVASTAKSTAPNQAVPLKLPPDFTATLHCNPAVPSNKVGVKPTTFLLPDSQAFAIPKADEFEADDVMPDSAAKTPCYLVKVNPKTNKSFIQQ